MRKFKSTDMGDLFNGKIKVQYKDGRVPRNVFFNTTFPKNKKFFTENDFGPDDSEMYWHDENGKCKEVPGFDLMVVE